MKVSLILADGTGFSGESFGFEQPVSGELVFNTTMTGYPELLTDPSVKGQMIVMTYPLIGNYGVQPFGKDKYGLITNAESEHLHAKALIVSEISDYYSHWNSEESLDSWMKKEKVPGVYGIDTRELTKHIRQHGSMTGKLVYEGMPSPLEFNCTNLISKVSCSEPIFYQLGKSKTIVVVDCGIRTSVLRCLLQKDLSVIRVPWNYDYTSIDYDGLFISNGPGNPSYCGEAISILEKALSLSDKPVMGVGMGCLIMALAAGMDTYKLPFGHHTHNQPVQLVDTYRCFITSQSHNYAIRKESVLGDWKVYMTNLHDGSIEAIKNIEKPWFGTMFHSESDVINTDVSFIYDDFIHKL